jgi:hypothetical protein
MSFKPDFLSELPAPLQGPAGDLFEYGRDFAEEWLKEVLGIGQPDVFGEQPLPTNYIDPHVIAARKEQLLYIQHIPSKKKIGLFAMMTSFSNNYSLAWDTEQVYGRPDPIAGYRNTTRSLRLGFNLVSANLAEARFNYNKTLGRGGTERVSLSNMFYPTYKLINKYKTIASPPIIALKHAQLIQSYGNTVDGGFLVGYITDCTITPKFDQGVYESKKDGNFIYPKIIDIGFTFNILHDYDLGWKASTGFLAELFPELGSGEDIGRIIGGRLGGDTGAKLGAILGGGADDIVNDIFYDEGSPELETAPPGDATSGGLVGVIADVGMDVLLGK